MLRNYTNCIQISQLSAKCNFEANPRTCGPLVSLESENNLYPVRFILWVGIIGCTFVAHISKNHVSNLLNLQFWQQIMFSNGNESSIASQYPIATSRYPVGTSKYPIATSNYIAATSKQHPVAAKISVVTIAGCLLLTEGSLLQRDWNWQWIVMESCPTWMTFHINGYKFWFCLTPAL